MKYAVIYSSETGNTARLAEVIRQELGEEECLYFGLPKEAPAEKLAQAEVLFVGFWTDKGNCNSETAEFLQSLAGRRIFLFGTAGFGGEERFLQNILENAGKKVPGSNQILGSYMCRGRMSQEVRQHFQGLLQRSPETELIKTMLANYEGSLPHPNAEDLEGLRRKLRELPAV